MWQEIIFASFVTYILAIIIVDSTIMNKPKKWLLPRTLWLISDDKWILNCRFCTMFWVAIIVTLSFQLPIYTSLIIYGISHFLSTQERR